MSTDISLSIVAAFDDFRRCAHILAEGLSEQGELFVFVAYYGH